jgi:hypothetical protein
MNTEFNGLAGTRLLLDRALPTFDSDLFRLRYTADTALALLSAFEQTNTSELTTVENGYYPTGGYYPSVRGSALHTA